jgi:hypothetical protein
LEPIDEAAELAAREDGATGYDQQADRRAMRVCVAREIIEEGLRATER